MRQPIHKRTLLEDAISEYEYITLNGTVEEEKTCQVDASFDNTVDELIGPKVFGESANFDASNNNTSPYTLLTAQSQSKI